MSSALTMWTGVGAAAALVVGVGVGVAVTGDDDPGDPLPAVTVVDDEVPPAQMDTTAAETVDEVDTADAVDAIGAIVGPSARVRVLTYACPDDGPVGELGGGDRVIATGVDGSGAWLQLRNPAALDGRVWVAASTVTPDRSFGDLPVTPCPARFADAVPPTTVAPTTTEPDASTTTTPTPDTTSTTAPPPAATPPPTTPPSTAPPPTSPPPTTPPPTTPPDTTGPSITSVNASPGQIWETSPALCTAQPKTATISASATDPSGVASITASWNFAGGGTITLQGGSTRTGTFGPFSDLSLTNPPYTQSVTITVRATDGSGNTSQATTSVVVTGDSDCFG